MYLWETHHTVINELKTPWLHMLHEEIMIFTKCEKEIISIIFFLITWDEIIKGRCAVNEQEQHFIQKFKLV